MSTTSTAEIFFPRESRRIAGYVNIPAGFFLGYSFPTMFYLSGRLSYRFPQEDTDHITSFLYRIQTTSDPTIQATMQAPVNGTIHPGSFLVVRMPFGWFAT